LILEFLSLLNSEIEKKLSLQKTEDIESGQFLQHDVPGPIIQQSPPPILLLRVTLAAIGFQPPTTPPPDWTLGHYFCRGVLKCRHPSNSSLVQILCTTDFFLREVLLNHSNGGRDEDELLDHDEEVPLDPQYGGQDEEYCWNVNVEARMKGTI
jgi:hypothetical protein